HVPVRRDPGIGCPSIAAPPRRLVVPLGGAGTEASAGLRVRSPCQGRATQGCEAGAGTSVLRWDSNPDELDVDRSGDKRVWRGRLVVGVPYRGPVRGTSAAVGHLMAPT